MLSSWRTNLALYNILHNPQKDYSNKLSKDRRYMNIIQKSAYLYINNNWILKLIKKPLTTTTYMKYLR